MRLPLRQISPGNQLWHLPGKIDAPQSGRFYAHRLPEHAGRRHGFGPKRMPIVDSVVNILGGLLSGQDVMTPDRWCSAARIGPNNAQYGWILIKREFCYRPDGGRRSGGMIHDRLRHQKRGSTCCQLQQGNKGTKHCSRFFQCHLGYLKVRGMKKAASAIDRSGFQCLQ